MVAAGREPVASGPAAGGLSVDDVAAGATTSLMVEQAGAAVPGLPGTVS
jgi:hypothetical protein